MFHQKESYLLEHRRRQLTARFKDEKQLQWINLSQVPGIGEKLHAWMQAAGRIRGIHIRITFDVKEIPEGVQLNV